MSEKQILNALTRPRSANNKKNEEERGKKIWKIGRKCVEAFITKEIKDGAHGKHNIE